MEARRTPDTTRPRARRERKRRGVDKRKSTETSPEPGSTRLEWHVKWTEERHDPEERGRLPDSRHKTHKATPRLAPTGRLPLESTPTAVPPHPPVSLG